MQLCSKPKGAGRIKTKTFRKRGQLLSRPPTTGPKWGSLIVTVCKFIFMTYSLLCANPCTSLQQTQMLFHEYLYSDLL